MSYYLCIRCGEEPENNSVCQSCGNNLKSDNELLRFGHDAYFFGYIYRLEYTFQTNAYGYVGSKYMLPEPESIWQLLATFALGGIVGNLTYDTFKLIGKKLINQVKKNKKANEYKEFIEIVSDDDKLKKIFYYIQDYYLGMPNVDKELRKAIYEEKLIEITDHEIPNIEFEKLKKLHPEKSVAEIADFLLKKRSKIIKDHENGKIIIKVPTKKKLKKILNNQKK